MALVKIKDKKPKFDFYFTYCMWSTFFFFTWTENTKHRLFNCSYLSVSLTEHFFATEDLQYKYFLLHKPAVLQSFYNYMFIFKCLLISQIILVHRNRFTYSVLHFVWFSLFQPCSIENPLCINAMNNAEE